MAASIEPGPVRRAVALGSLILAGEAIFIPPFHPGRYFRTTILDSFGITELELGQAQAWYGLAAMVSYALGGPLADRVGPRVLMSLSLVATGLGSFYMATLPSVFGLNCLFAFWGVSTIFAFWSPMIRATREIGGDLSQGRAFGVLDGGRGLFAWLVAAVSAYTLSDLLAADAADGALRNLMTGYAAVSFAVAAVVWFGLPRSRAAAQREAAFKSRDALRLLAEPAVWLQGLIVLTAYCAYKAFDAYGHFSEDVYGLDKSQAATLTAWLTFLRALAAIGAGLLADRLVGSRRAVMLSFATLAAAFASLRFLPPEAGWFYLVVANMAVAWAACCALRGVYFALLAETDIPPGLTGSAAGIVSFVGFTPDIFWAFYSGWLITSARESGDVLLGYQRLWLSLMALALAGLVAAALLRRRRPAD